MSKSYIPTKWVGGKTIGTADVMNNIENGIVEVHDRLDIMEEQYTNDIGQLIANTSLKVDTNLSEQNSKIDAFVLNTTNQVNTNLTAQNNKVDTLVSSTTLDLNTYKSDKDTQINESLNTSKTQINESLTSYENTINALRTDFDRLEQKDASQSTRFETIESENTTQNTRLDKIEYQNKVQDTYIQGLFNENGDKRLTIEGQGNDLKLEGSKEGLVQVDKIVGNTVVNLCTGEDRELTLNGDIEGAGTYITATEGVDGGLVDVVCEGNTLVNLVRDYRLGYYDLDGSFTKGTPHIVTFEIDVPANRQITYVWLGKNVSDTNYSVRILRCLNNDGKLTSLDNIPENYSIKSLNIPMTATKILIQVNNFNSTYPIDVFELSKNIILLEGDYTNKPIPTEYFEGIKSVGQDDVNGHGIEITSNNKNLFNYDYEIGLINNQGSIQTGGTYDGLRTTEFVEVLRGQTYYFGNFTDLNGIIQSARILEFDKDKNVLGNPVKILDKYTVIESCRYIKISFDCRYNDGVNSQANPPSDTDFQFSMSFENLTSYVLPLSNTLSIPLSEPLRALPSGVKDKPVKREGKWYIERKCGEVVLNGSEQEGWGFNTIHGNTTSFISHSFIGHPTFNSVMSDRFVSTSSIPNDVECIRLSTASGKIIIQILTLKLTTQDTTGFKAWLQVNPVTVVYQLATPIYEPLNVSPELETYLETTHISNNSIIPCNIQVKNTGYSALIKPSTLYTVIADKNTTGTLGVNLGGTKATTSTNKLTITTPATLTENTLRLYGKGLKASKIRLLEGDETTLSYPYFEGLKSTFEDGLVTEEMVSQGLEKIENLGKYKASVKVRGKNLFDIKDFTAYFIGYGVNRDILFDHQLFKPTFKINPDNSVNIIGTSSGGSGCIVIPITLSIGVEYTLSTKKTGDEIRLYIFDKNGKYCDNAAISSTSSQGKLSFKAISTTMFVGIGIYDKRICTVSDIQLEQSALATDFSPYYERTETVYLNSLLLKGDEIVCKEDGLYHYHKMKKGELTIDNLVSFNSNSGIYVNYYEFTKIFNDKKWTGWGALDQQNIICNSLNTGLDFKVWDKTNYEYSLCNAANGNFWLFVPKTITSKDWLQANPTTVVYELAEPYYEKISDYPITLEIPNNATLEVESFIPCDTIKSTYTGNVPSVYSLEEVGTQNTLEINDTQIAVDFILMSNPSMMSAMTNLTTRGINEMGAYFAGRIIKGFLDYNAVITKYPEFKDDIDFILRSEGREDLIK